MRQPDTPVERFNPKRTPQTVRLLTADDILSAADKPIGISTILPLKHLLVQGLLSFGDATDFEFGRLNILVGPNGSGKTNLINCIRVLRSSPYDIQDAFLDSGFEEWLYKGKRIPAATVFMQATTQTADIPDGVLHHIRFGPTVNSRPPLEEVVVDAVAKEDLSASYFTGSYRSNARLTTTGVGKRRRTRELGSAEYNPFQSILSQIRDVGQYPEITHLASLYSNFRIYSEWTFGRNSNLREATPIVRSDTILSESMDDLALVLNGLEKTVAHEKIRLLLRELKDSYRDFVTRIIFGRVGLELLESPLDSPIPSKRLSDGTLRFLALAAILLQTAPPALICLEEPELGMHPDMIRMVAGMIVDASAKTQVIVTTHSEHLLSALQDDFDVLFAFDAGPNGSVVRPLLRSEYVEWRAEHELGELWSSGEIGGVRY